MNVGLMTTLRRHPSLRGLPAVRDARKALRKARHLFETHATQLQQQARLQPHAQRQRTPVDLAPLTGDSRLAGANLAYFPHLPVNFPHVGILEACTMLLHRTAHFAFDLVLVLNAHCIDPCRLLQRSMVNQTGLKMAFFLLFLQLAYSGSLGGSWLPRT